MTQLGTQLGTQLTTGRLDREDTDRHHDTAPAGELDRQHGASPDKAALTRRIRKATVIVLAVCVLAIPLALMAARWPSWWSWIAAEDTPMTWLQSVTLVVVGVLSALAAYVTALTGGRASSGDGLPIERPPGRRPRGLSRRPVLGWSLLSVAFVALAFDERFAIHERVRDRILAPREVRLPFLPRVGAGDFLMILVAVAGLLALPGLWRLFAHDRLARTLLLVGVGLAATAVAMDSVSPDLMSIDVERLEQTTEECVEFAAGLALLAATGTRLQGLLADHC